MSDFGFNAHIHLGAGRPERAYRANVRTKYVVSRRTGKRTKFHIPIYAASRFVDGRMIVGARFACGGSSSEVTPTNRDDEYRPCWDCILSLPNIAEPAPSSYVTVYAHLDCDGQVLYVGQTSNLRQRTSRHRGSSIWFPAVAKVQILSEHTSRDAALVAERDAIRELRPQFNVQHNGARDGAA